MRRKKIAFCIGGIVVLGLVVVLWVVPWWRVENRGYNCRFCGAQKTKKTIRVIGVPVWIKWGAVTENSSTEIYAMYIGEPHKHEWAGGGYSCASGTLSGVNIHSDGAHTVSPFAPFQFLLTHRALEAVSQVKSWPREQRIELYRAIRDCTDRADCEDVQKAFEEAKSGAAEEVWKEWLSKKVGVEKSRD